MDPRERVETVLRGGVPDKIPFTSYKLFIPVSETERKLRNLGMCFLFHELSYTGVNMVTPNCDLRTISFIDKASGRSYKKTEVDTPKGLLTSLAIDLGFTEWSQERIFKSEKDYDSLIAYVDDMHYEVDKSTYKKSADLLGNDCVIVPWVGFSPLLDIINYLMGPEVFSFEWMDNFQKIHKLFESLHRRDLRYMEALCQTDLPLINYCGNISPAIVGLERAKEYVFPIINEMAGIIHKSGKMLAVHFDDNCALLSDLIAESGIDIIEAFTPAPDTDMTVKQAREKWQDKILWVNFPSSQHRRPNNIIEDSVKRIIDENGRKDRLLIGITEDMPQTEWQRSTMAIAETIDKIRF